jgi:tetratricopeptide (TPR) repeat protein
LDRSAFLPPRSFAHGSQRTSLGAEESNLLVQCVGLSRSNEIHSVDRVIGQDPLRQFLVAAPGGRWQALEATYDPRHDEWFNVYGNEDRQPGEWGHWTGRGMNWNSMCAGCHNTRLRKNYDEATDSYRTIMAETSVGCEACHGPLEAHVDWQARYGRTAQRDPSVPKFNRQQSMDNCGFCHSRRSDLTGDFKPGDSYFDHQSLAIADRTEMFYPDGQVREEDYELAAFLGSRMHDKGVTCLDCHQVHSAKTILPGNWLCLRCHNGSYSNAPIIDPLAHSHHKVFGYSASGLQTNLDLSAYDSSQINETGGECVNCHMPQTTYMQRHRRHDHGFTIPDPLLTKQFGIPNACNRCHADKDVAWSLAAVEKWYGPRMERPTRYRAQSIARARSGDPAAREALLSLLATNDHPYWQAVAVGLLESWTGDAPTDRAILGGLDHPHPLVRATAARAASPLLNSSSAAVSAVRKLLDDPIRSVRVSAAWTLRAVVETNLLAAIELKYFLDLNADQPVGQMQKGAYRFARAELLPALEHFQKAVAWDTNSAPSRRELAVTLSSLGRAAEAVQQLQTACTLASNEPVYHFELALALSEVGKLPDAIRELREAVRLGPRYGRAWYNLGLALNAAGEPERALEALLRAEEASPSDAQIPYARATILVRLGRLEEAKSAAARCLEIVPNSTEARRLIEEIDRVSSAK